VNILRSCVTESIVLDRTSSGKPTYYSPIWEFISFWSYSSSLS